MSSPTLIDSHCHLDFEVFNDDRTEVLQRAKQHNISDIIIPGTEKKHWKRITTLCNKYPQLHASYGLHPYWVKNHKEQDLEKLENYIDNNHSIAIGECGLDFRPQQADKKTQLKFFEAQLSLAANYKLPVIIHSVRATEVVIQSIKKFNHLNGMIHSYSGSYEQAKQLIDLNFKISIGGSVTYENAIKTRKVATKIPLTSLLLETDAPDQPDKVNTGKRNEPAYLINTLDVISDLRSEQQEIIAQQTTLNAKKLFGI